MNLDAKKIAMIVGGILLAGIVFVVMYGKPAGPNNCKSGDVACDYTKGN